MGADATDRRNCPGCGAEVTGADLEDLKCPTCGEDLPPHNG